MWARPRNRKPSVRGFDKLTEAEKLEDAQRHPAFRRGSGYHPTGMGFDGDSELLIRITEGTEQYQQVMTFRYLHRSVTLRKNNAVEVWGFGGWVKLYRLRIRAPCDQLRITLASGISFGCDPNQCFLGVDLVWRPARDLNAIIEIDPGDMITYKIVEIAKLEVLPLHLPLYVIATDILDMRTSAAVMGGIMTRTYCDPYNHPTVKTWNRVIQ